MKEIRVKLKNFWTSCPKEKFALDMLANLKDQFDIVYDEENYNLEICSVFGTEPLDPNVLSVFWSVEGIWDLKKFDISKYDYAFYFFPEKLIDDPKYCRINMVAPSMVGPRNINIDEVKGRHKNFCNYIYSHPVPFRDEICGTLTQYKRVDAPGLCMNNMAPIGTYEDAWKSRTAKDWASEKFEFIKDYKFTIACENHSLPGYVTEKIIQPLNANSIPIYWGNPDIATDFNPNAFINYYDYNNMHDFLAQIKRVDQNDGLYEQMLLQPRAFSHSQDRATEHWVKILSAV